MLAASALSVLLLAAAQPAPGRPAAPLRVDVLSLIAPRRVEVAASAPLELPGGRVERSHGGLVVGLRGGRVVATARDGRRWTAARVRVGAAGERTDLVVEGRERIARALRGRVTLVAGEGGLRLVAEVATEDLVASVVAAELDGASPRAALEAAAVAARSYVEANRGRHGAAGADLCDTSHCLVSKGDAGAGEPAARAAEATRGLVLVAGGRVLAGFFTACCGGSTTTPSRLWGGADIGLYSSVVCTACEGSQHYRWRRELPAARVHAALVPLVGFRAGPATDLRADSGGDGWVRRVTVRSGRHEASVRGDAFRIAVGRRLGWEALPSPRFAVERRGASYLFRGGGFGHGAGLCLEGAVARAAAGAARDEILALYFPKARTAPLPAGAGSVYP